MTAVLWLVAGIAPFALCLLLAQIQQGRERYRVYQFERENWAPHNEHEWIVHPVLKNQIVCRYCPMTASADTHPKGGDAKQGSVHG